MTCKDIMRQSRLIEIIDWKFSGGLLVAIFISGGPMPPWFFFCIFHWPKRAPLKKKKRPSEEKKHPSEEKKAPPWKVSPLINLPLLLKNVTGTQGELYLIDGELRMFQIVSVTAVTLCYRCKWESGGAVSLLLLQAGFHILKLSVILQVLQV